MYLGRVHCSFEVPGLLSGRVGHMSMAVRSVRLACGPRGALLLLLLVLLGVLVVLHKVRSLIKTKSCKIT